MNSAAAKPTNATLDFAGAYHVGSTVMPSVVVSFDRHMSRYSERVTYRAVPGDGATGCGLYVTRLGEGYGYCVTPYLQRGGTSDVPADVAEMLWSAIDAQA
jgi:hypothetical protein